MKIKRLIMIFASVAVITSSVLMAEEEKKEANSSTCSSHLKVPGITDKMSVTEKVTISKKVSYFPIEVKSSFYLKHYIRLGRFDQVVEDINHNPDFFAEVQITGLKKLADEHVELIYKSVRHITWHSYYTFGNKPKLVIKKDDVLNSGTIQLMQLDLTELKINETTGDYPYTFITLSGSPSSNNSLNVKAVKRDKVEDIIFLWEKEIEFLSQQDKYKKLPLIRTLLNNRLSKQLKNNEAVKLYNTYNKVGAKSFAKKYPNINKLVAPAFKKAIESGKFEIVKMSEDPEDLDVEELVVPAGTVLEIEKLPVSK